jgi:uncharacterized membrane protein YhaH (DUF805 family)
MIRELSRYLSVTARMHRASFWKFAAFWLPVAAMLMWGLAPHIRMKPEIVSAMCLFLAITLPVWVAASQRLHDTGRSSTIILVILAVPLVHLGFVQLYFTNTLSSENRFFGMVFALYYFAGFFFLITLHLFAIIVALFRCASPSQSGSNQYGPNPLEVPS